MAHTPSSTHLTPPVSRMTSDPYSSREGHDTSVIERRDPVVWGSTPGPLSSRELGQYEADGFIVRERLFDDEEVATMMDELLRLPSVYVGRPDDEVVSEPGAGALRSIFRVHQTSPVFEKIAQDPRLVDTARQILDGDIYVHQSRINYKHAFDGRAFPWHSDFETWHVEDGMPLMRAISASILLTENTPLNGPLMLVPGSQQFYLRCPGRTPSEHYKESLRDQRYGVPTPDALAWLMERRKPVQVLGPPGSVVFFDSNTMHGSSGNMSPFPRHNVFLVFNSVENALVDPFCGLPPRPRFLAERNALSLT